MRKRTVIGKLLCVFKPKKNDILSEAENIINNYICNQDDCLQPPVKTPLGKINFVMNIAIIALTVVLAYMLYRLIG